MLLEHCPPRLRTLQSGARHLGHCMKLLARLSGLTKVRDRIGCDNKPWHERDVIISRGATEAFSQHGG
eukprot:13988308-Alexandrium_andersonii.AAC.1